MTDDKYIPPIHISVRLENGLKAAVLCKDVADTGDMYTSNIEGVTCFICLEVYDKYLTLVDEEPLPVEEKEH